MRAHIPSIITALLAALSVAALVAAPAAVAAPAPVPAEAPSLGAIPLAFLRNQGQYCNVICPFVVQGAVNVPVGALHSPTAFVDALQGTGSPTRALGAALASITGPANAAATGIIDNDLTLVLPKAQNALQVAVVEAFNVGAAALQPGQLLAAVQAARTRILGALDQPIGVPVGPTGARTVFQVVAVETINVASAIAFQAGEMLLLGVVQTVDSAAQELAASGDPVAAVAAGATQAGVVVKAASGRVSGAVDTAVTNITAALRDPFPTASTPASASAQATVTAPTTRRSAAADIGKSGTENPATPPTRTGSADRLAGTLAKVGAGDVDRRATVTHRRPFGVLARPQRVSHPDRDSVGRSTNADGATPKDTGETAGAVGSEAGP